LKEFPNRISPGKRTNQNCPVLLTQNVATFCELPLEPREKSTNGKNKSWLKEKIPPKQETFKDWAKKRVKNIIVRIKTVKDAKRLCFIH